MKYKLYDSEYKVNALIFAFETGIAQYKDEWYIHADD